VLGPGTGHRWRGIHFTTRTDSLLGGQSFRAAFEAGLRERVLGEGKGLWSPLESKPGDLRGSFEKDLEKREDRVVSPLLWGV